MMDIQHPLLWRQSVRWLQPLHSVHAGFLGRGSELLACLFACIMPISGMSDKALFVFVVLHCY
jgi:hypothetical protein